MKPPTAILLAALTAPLAGCGDGVLRSDRVLGSIELSHETITATEGEAVPLTIRVLDQNGRPFDRLPAWVAPTWSSSDEARVATVSGAVTAVQPGEATVTLTVADRDASARVRVNPGQLAIRVEGIQLSQSVQRPDGSVPMVRGRDGFLRIFVTADQINYFEAGLRVRLFHGATEVRSWKLTAPTESIPTILAEEQLTSTWNLPIPGTLIQPGLAVLVDADPDGALPVTPASRLVYPESGIPAPVEVRELPPLRLQLIPITDAYGSTGNVGEHNKQMYVDALVRMFPIDQLEVTVREPFVSIYPAEFLDDWLGMLFQLSAMRAAEGSSDYYYGVVRRARGNLQGVGFLGYPTAMGFDVLPEAAFTLAHELGHNFNQLHAPCGNPGFVDPGYPYKDGEIGVYGLDVAAEQLIQPVIPDIMGYCQPRWVSDYTYERILEYRLSDEYGDEQPAPAEPSLLVWGRVSENGIHLEPAFEVNASPQLPRDRGSFTIEGRSRAGSILFSHSFSPMAAGHGASSDRFFVFVVPLSNAAAGELGSLHARGEGREALRTATRTPAAAAPEFLLERRVGRASLAWQAESHPMVMVRDPSSGRILTFARAGELELPVVDRELELVFSDGVRSTRVRVPPR
jgi:hypothetical protein